MNLPQRIVPILVAKGSNPTYLAAWRCHKRSLSGATNSLVGSDVEERAAITASGDLIARLEDRCNRATASFVLQMQCNNRAFDRITPTI